MRFGYVLLGLVALTSIHTSSGQCSNGLAGFQTDDICCAASCGTCGGGGCGRLPGGAENCCTSRVRDSGVMCSASQAAPCIVENESMCDNGISGVQSGNICCDATCGTCGGSGCSRRPGGSSSCCSSRIRDADMMCSVTGASPCIIDVPIPEGVVCSNRLPGVQDGDICCDASCGTCGGSGCARRPGGSSSCCTSRIRESAAMCDSTMEAPCIIDPTPAPTTVAPTTVAPTTVAPTTVAPTTVAPTTVAPTTVAPTTVAPTTVAPTTVAPTTVAPTTVAPTTVAPTTVAPTTVAPTTVAPTTVAPTTVAPTTVAPTTVAPTTAAPTPMCSNGLPGFQTGSACCDVGCGVCGGSDCITLPGGAFACCDILIEVTGEECSVTMAAPCIVDN